ncbi:MAG: sodium:calcium antiporter, partial [Candidatus Binataceae bacterium]
YRLGIAEAAVGSVLAAVGTALPETLIPAVALLAGRESRDARAAVGVGAIVGAPLMLSTVALLVMGIAGWAYRARRRRVALHVVRNDARRDLYFFLPVFLIVMAAGTIPLGPIARRASATALLIAYCGYVAAMMRLKRSADAEVEHGLYAERLLGGNPMRPRGWTVALQVIAGAGAILVGAGAFVNQVVLFSARLGVDPAVLSLILSPLATELPEKYNSVVWIRRGKDNLALANITGAMVFQSCVPVALGIAFTPWRLTPPELLGGTITLVSAAILCINLRHGELRAPVLAIGGAAYAIFLLGLAYLGVR